MPLFGPPDIEKMKQKRNIRGLVKALKHFNADIRCEAAKALRTIGDVRAVDPLIAALQDKSAYVRCDAAGALGAIGDARAVEPLSAGLQDTETASPLHTCLCAEAAKALGAIGDARAVNLLIAALQDKDVFIRKQAAEALGKIGDMHAMQPLIAALGNESKSDYNASESIKKAISKLGKAAEPTQDEDRAWYWIGRGEWEMCARIGAPAVMPLISVLKNTSMQKASRINIARKLVYLYRSDELKDELKQAILSQRDTIQKHTDWSTEHTDRQVLGTYGGCGHQDTGGHTDEGIGVDFPL